MMFSLYILVLSYPKQSWLDGFANKGKFVFLETLHSELKNWVLLLRTSTYEEALRIGSVRVNDPRSVALAFEIVFPGEQKGLCSWQWCDHLGVHHE